MSIVFHSTSYHCALQQDSDKTDTTHHMSFEISLSTVKMLRWFFYFNRVAEDECKSNADKLAVEAIDALIKKMEATDL